MVKIQKYYIIVLYIMSGTQQSFASNSWKKNGGINRTATNNIVRTPKAITGKLNIYENISKNIFSLLLNFK